MEIEAFDEPLRGKKVLVVGSIDLALSRFSIVESTSLFKGKNILVISDNGMTNPLLFRKRWDVIFRLKDSFDLQMLATYVTHGAKPLRIFWSGTDVPKGLTAKLIGDCTLIGFSETGTHAGCEWDVILFPIGHAYDSMERCLLTRHQHIPFMLQRIKTHLGEIADSKAGIAWAVDKGMPGSLFWYDPSEGRQTIQPFTKEEASVLLQSISKWLMP